MSDKESVRVSVKQSDSIEKIDLKIAQLKARKKLMENKQRTKEKKERERLYYKFGELVERYLKFETAEQFEEFLKKHVLTP